MSGACGSKDQHEEEDNYAEHSLQVRPQKCLDVQGAPGFPRAQRYCISTDFQQTSLRGRIAETPRATDAEISASHKAEFLRTLCRQKLDPCMPKSPGLMSAGSPTCRELRWICADKHWTCLNPRAFKNKAVEFSDRLWKRGRLGFQDPGQQEDPKDARFGRCS